MIEKSEKDFKNPIGKAPIAVIDIGSNAVRFVVFHAMARVPVQLHNERVICGLGRDLNITGMLNPEGAELARNALARFASLIKAMNISTVLTVATAALREAKDGLDFVQEIKQKFGLHISIIDGEEEARLSAVGVVANHGLIDGVVGDFGGGSLELIKIEKGKIVSGHSFPLGALRIMAIEGQAAKDDYIRKHLEQLDLEMFARAPFYILGGAWRTLGRAHIFMENAPIKVLDHYQLSPEEALEFTSFIARQDQQALERMAGMPKRRVKDMPAAALVMQHVLKRLKPKSMTFSGTGLREGLMFDSLPHGVKAQDPLLASCHDVGVETSRFASSDDLLQMMRWMMPLFPDAKHEFAKTVQSTCLLSDVGWFEHEDYRARHAYQRILNLPLYGLSHERRAFMALSVYVRHQGYLRDLSRDSFELTEAAQKVLSYDERQYAVILGLAMRLAYTLTGGALNLLKHSEIKIERETVILTLYGQHRGMNGKVIEKHLENLARNMACDSKIAF